MGIRNGREGRREIYSEITHYPSWGLGIRFRREGGVTAIISLPLMGIRNGREGRREIYSEITHYPSWGLGICTSQQPPLTVVHLITPHGD